MSPDQQAELRARAHADTDCQPALAARDCAALAQLLSSGRTCANEREIGYGTILETIGIEAGNRLIDHIQAASDMRHVVPLLQQGRLRIGSPVAQAALRQFGADVLSPAAAEVLCALGMQPEQLTAAQVAAALFNADGSAK